MADDRAILGSRFSDHRSKLFYGVPTMYTVYSLYTQYTLYIYVYKAWMKERDLLFTLLTAPATGRLSVWAVM